MRHVSTASPGRQGITVLGLLLLIIAIVVAAFFLVRYLRNRPAVSLKAAEHVVLIPRSARTDISAAAA